MPPLRTLVTFQSSAFNTSQERDDFINPGNFGDDLARFLMDGLRRHGFEVEEGVGQEDHGWFFTYRCNGVPYDFIVGWADGEWIGWVERRVGFLASLLGARQRGIAPEAAQAIHAALSDAPEISGIQWHRPADFQAGRTDAGSADPLA
jgi:hypothetical protein